MSIPPRVLRKPGARPRKRPLLFLEPTLNTHVYIDGFKLYYGALKNTAYKWLDVAKLCQLLLPNFGTLKIKYYTAKVGARPNDPEQPTRQQLYLRALMTIPGLEIVYGQFLQSRVRMRLATPSPSGQKFIEVIKTEEKGSDVNIATHMMHDGHRGLYDVAIILSNDSDLVEPVKIVRYELGKTVGMLCPHKRPSFTLQQHVSFMKPIRRGLLDACQFPTVLRDDTGIFFKPPSW